MTLRVEGHHLPGRACGPDDRGVERTDVHAGIQLGQDPRFLEPADRQRVQWTTDIDAVTADDGRLDSRGAAVRGKRGDRFV